MASSATSEIVHVLEAILPTECLVHDSDGSSCKDFCEQQHELGQEILLVDHNIPAGSLSSKFNDNSAVPQAVNVQTNEDTADFPPTVDKNLGDKNPLPGMESSAGDLPVFCENPFLVQPTTEDSDDSIIFISSQTKQQPICYNSYSVILDSIENNVTYCQGPHKDFQLTPVLQFPKQK